MNVNLLFDESARNNDESFILHIWQISPAFRYLSYLALIPTQVKVVFFNYHWNQHV